MKPPGKCGKFYGIPKVHKGVPEGKNIPPLRPIVSLSGSNAELISKFIDYHSKEEVKRVTSYVQDTPDLLRIFEAENDKG